MYFYTIGLPKNMFFCYNQTGKIAWGRNGHRKMPSAGYSESEIAAEAGRGPAERGRKKRSGT